MCSLLTNVVIIMPVPATASLSGKEQRSQTHCSIKETKMQGEEEQQGEKMLSHIFVAAGQQSEAQPDHFT